MDRDQVAIVSIEAQPGTVPVKFEEHVPYVRRGYRFGVVYVLEDGTRVEATVSKQLLRDARAELASLPKAPEHPMEVIYHDGRFAGTSTTYGLGRRAAV